MMQDTSFDPLLGLCGAGHVLLKDSLACSGAFLLPWIVKHCVHQQHKVGAAQRQSLQSSSVARVDGL